MHERQQTGINEKAAFKIFLRKWLPTDHNHSKIIIYCDDEFHRGTYEEIFQEYNIMPYPCAPHEHKTNGLAERRVAIVENYISTLLLAAQLPQDYSSYAVQWIDLLP